MDATLERLIADQVAASTALANYARTLTAAPTPVVPPPSSTAVAFQNAQAWPTISDQPLTSDTDPRGWSVSSGTNWAIVDDATAPLSPPKVLQFTYPQGMAGGSAPATIVHGIGGKKQFYARFPFKHNPEWQGHNSNVNKLAHLFAGGAGGECYLAMYGSPGGPYSLRTNLQFGSQRWLTANMAVIPVAVGQWHIAEWLFDYSAHRCAFALDGRVVADYLDVTFPTDGLAEFQFSPTWGGMGDTKQHADYLRIDHVLLKGA